MTIPATNAISSISTPSRSEDSSDKLDRYLVISADMNYKDDAKRVFRSWAIHHVLAEGYDQAKTLVSISAGTRISPVEAFSGEDLSLLLERMACAPLSLEHPVVDDEAEF